jgi:hypothetical protein
MSKKEEEKVRSGIEDPPTYKGPPHKLANVFGLVDWNGFDSRSVNEGRSKNYEL